MSKKEQEMRVWLCQEAGEQFIIEAANYDMALEKASFWNAEIIKEIKE
jgi:hypothetical protein